MSRAEDYLDKWLIKNDKIVKLENKWDYFYPKEKEVKNLVNFAVKLAQEVAVAEHNKEMREQIEKDDAHLSKVIAFADKKRKEEIVKVRAEEKNYFEKIFNAREKEWQKEVIEARKKTLEHINNFINLNLKEREKELRELK